MNAKLRQMGVALLAAALLCGALPLGATQLPSDARLLKGELSNGVKWIYRQHDNPPGKMALMIHVDVGSLNETDQPGTYFVHLTGILPSPGAATGELIVVR